MLKRTTLSTLPSVFKARVDLSPKEEAFRFFDPQSQDWLSLSWLDAYRHTLKIRNALLAEKLQAGDRILLAINNSPAWVYIEQAALYMGLVVVALPASMPPGQLAKIAEEVGAKIIFIHSDSLWHPIHSTPYVNQAKITVVCYLKQKNINHALYFDQWQTRKLNQRSAPIAPTISADALATVIYTSGSSGKPRGVKHSHKNLINNAFACLERVEISEQDKMLSVTPISHCMERVAGYYVPIIVGASIVFPKSPNTILEDLAQSKATIIITTPHYLTRAYKRLINRLTFSAKLLDQYLDYSQGIGQWRLKFLLWPIIRYSAENKAKKHLLHQLRFVMSGGSALSPKIILLSHLLNLPVLQGYGLTEAGGVISTNSVKHNSPNSVGKVLNNAQILLIEDEISIKSNSLMLGYWDEQTPTNESTDWLRTGDLAYLKDDYLFIKGRKNSTIHLSTGETIFPLPIENLLIQDALFEQVLLYGENKETIVLCCQLNPEAWLKFQQKCAKQPEINPHAMTKRLNALLLIHVNLILRAAPEQIQIPLIFSTLKPWSLENGMLNAMGKINQKAVEAFFVDKIKPLR